MKWFSSLLVVACVLIVSAARGQSLEDQYIQVFALIQEGDMLSANAQAAAALAKYSEARAALQRFQKTSPQWNERVIKFRLADVDSKIEALTGTAPAVPAVAPAKPTVPTLPAPTPGPAVSPPRAPAETPPGDNVKNQLQRLEAQVRQLQAEKSAVEAKLREALSVQPAAVDPQELAKAQSRVNTLQKENDLLKVTLDQEKSKAVDPAALEELKKQLMEANEKLAVQTEAVKRLDQERRGLQRKLEAQLPAARGVDGIQESQSNLANVQEQTRELHEIIQKLTAERQALQTRIQQMSGDTEALTALRQENELLKKQVADLRSAPPTRGEDDDAARQLAAARAEIAALQSDKEVLRLERLALEERVKKLAAAVQPRDSALPEPFSSKDSSRIRTLEREKQDLQKHLEAARKSLNGRRTRNSASEIGDLQKQVEQLGSRLAVLEATPVPYTAEELALFSTPPVRLGPTQPAGKSGSAPPPPPAAASLAAEARRLFAARDFNRAEGKYQEVLQHDRSNAASLANLASVQIEIGRYDEAEKNLSKALAQYPNDAFILLVTGNLKFRQKKTDEAIDVLSRAAAIEPENPEVQNLLGVTLGQKGQRAAAETALRKALQLNPNYSEAHMNLAVVYVAQEPPAVELARWHYDKGRGLGAASNPDLEKALQSRKAP